MITDPTVVKFSNEQVRRAADRIASVYNFIQEPLAEFASLGIAALIADPTQTIDDGSDVDGRTPITGQNILDLMALAQSLQDVFASGPQSGAQVAPSQLTAMQNQSFQALPDASTSVTVASLIAVNPQL